MNERDSGMSATIMTVERARVSSFLLSICGFGFRRAPNLEGTRLIQIMAKPIMVEA